MVDGTLTYVLPTPNMHVDDNAVADSPTGSIRLSKRNFSAVNLRVSQDLSDRYIITMHSET